MSAVAASAAGAYSAPSSTTFRTILEARRAENRRLSLDDAIAVLVPVCVDLKARHDKGELLYVHPAAIAAGPDGMMRIHPALAVPPTAARDRAALAPELVKATAPGNARASVFAVGAMLYEAVTGSAVGPGMRRPRDVDPSLPDSLEMLLGKALVADPAHRPDDLGALANAMHHLAPMKSIPPPDADMGALDQANGEPVDIRMSLLPPVDVQFSVAPGPPSTRGEPSSQSTPDLGASSAAVRATRDPTRHLANLKARLESDTRPRYVVNKERMDHGPFSAVELLQQIASNQFVGEDILRDELTGVAQKINEWDEFSPFAQHAGMHRNIAQEKREVAKVASAEKKAGAAKFIIGGILAAAIVTVLVFFVVKKVGERKDGGDLSDDPNAVDLSGGGSLKGRKKTATGGKGGGGGGGGGYHGGGSYEAALNSNNQEISMGGPKGGPDLTNAQLSAPMNNASFISGCGAPDSMKVQVRVAVQNGRAVGVSVYPSPPNAAVAGCIDRHVRGLGWPSNPKMDFLTTNY